MYIPTDLIPEIFKYVPFITCFRYPENKIGLDLKKHTLNKLDAKKYLQMHNKNIEEIVVHYGILNVENINLKNTIKLDGCFEFKDVNFVYNTAISLQNEIDDILMRNFFEGGDVIDDGI